jgi:hypothetical protein
MTNEIVLSTNVGQINHVELKTKVTELIRWAHNRMGAKKDHDFEAMVIFDTNEMCRDLQSIAEFKVLKLTDLSKIFQKGLTGGYGDFFGLNCVTYAKWIRAHLSEQKTSGGTLEHEVVKKRLAEAKEPTFEEKRELSEANLQRVIEKYKRTGIVDDNGNPSYLYLWNTGQLRFDKEQWLNYCERAKHNETTRLNAKLTEAKNNVNKIAVNEITSELANINGALIQSIARNLAVKDWIEKQLNKK